MYAAAQQGRLLDGWIAGNSSADTEIKGSIKQLRQKTRQIIRDNPWGKNAHRSIISNVIGSSGIKLQAQV